MDMANCYAEPAPPAIDPTFLEALPPELRAEVLATQLTVPSSSSASGGNGGEGSSAASSQVSVDFLAALPPDIQAEVLEQERREQERRARAAAEPAAGEDLILFFFVNYFSQCYIRCHKSTRDGQCIFHCNPQYRSS